MAHPNTPKDILSVLSSVAVDLTTGLTSRQRFERLLSSAKQVIPCDAAAILKWENGVLIPLATEGLDKEVSSKRFLVSHHPRFQAILNSTEITLFDVNSDLPDPYDGLVNSCEGDLPVHACMGASLKVNKKLWGIITFDALDPNAFDSIDENLVTTFCALAAAAASSASYIERLESTVDRQKEVSSNLIEQVLGHQGDEMIGQSKPMLQLKKEIDIVSTSDLTVLITGETGTGKELVARAIHKNSDRKNQPIVYLNCSSLPENLAESELFGHKKGAFTGAVKDYKGKFELADGGTLFLDEIGELPLNLQAKLLRVLQSGELQPIGQEQITYVDVRVIAATNRNLKEEVIAGNFRQDLFQRLSVYPIHLPSLQERKSDIPLLTSYFIEKISRKFGLNGVTIESAAVERLNTYAWPGNIRELEHLITRTLLKLSTRPRQRINKLSSIDFDLPDFDSVDYIPEDPNQSDTYSLFSKIENTANEKSLTELTSEFQKNVIQGSLIRHNNNWSETARALNLDRSNLHRLAKRLGLK